jgi:hypothetical protein
MRKYFLLVFILIAAIKSQAQYVTDSVNMKPFLYDQFLNGTVQLKSGEIESVPLNYNTDNQSIVFIKNGKYLVIEDLETVDTIYLQQKKFIPVNKYFFSVVTESAPISLVVSYSNKMQPMMSTADHNGSSKQNVSQVSNTVTDVYATKLYKGNYSVEIRKHYWFKKNGLVYKVTPKKQFVNSFPSKASKQIEEFIDNNHINFTYEPDLVKLVEYCNKDLQY